MDDKRTPESHEIATLCVEVGIRPSCVITAGKDVLALEVGAYLGFQFRADFGRTHRAVIDHVDIHQAQVVQFFDQSQIQDIHFGIGYCAVECAIGGYAHPDSFCADGGNRSLGDFNGEADAVLDAAAPFIGALVGGGVEELIDHISVRTMQLDAVESGFNGEFGRIGIFGDGQRDVGFIHFDRDRMRLHAVAVRPHFSRSRDGRRSENLCICLHVCRMADASGVHQLYEYLAARLVHGLVHALPARHLLLRKHAGNAGIAQTVGGRRGAFGDDKARIGAQSVILFHQFVRYVAGGARTRHRRHDDAVFQLQFAQGGWGEQCVAHVVLLAGFAKNSLSRAGEG